MRDGGLWIAGGSVFADVIIWQVGLSEVGGILEGGVRGGWLEVGEIGKLKGH